MKPQAKLAVVFTLGAGILAFVGTAVLWLPGPWPRSRPG